MTQEKAIEIFQNLGRKEEEDQKTIYEACKIGINAINRVKELEHQLKLTELALRAVVSSFTEDCSSCFAMFTPPCPVLDPSNRRGSNDCIKAILKKIEEDKGIWELSWE